MLCVGDVVRWLPDADQTMVTWGHEQIKLHPVTVVQEIKNSGSVVITDLYTQKIVQRIKHPHEHKPQYRHHWDDSFFVKDEFLTAAHKAQKGKK